MAVPAGTLCYRSLVLSAKRIEDMDLPELLNHLAGYTPGSVDHSRLTTTIQVRLAELQDRSTRALVESTKGLVATTSKLVYATWGLVGATLVLVIAEIILKVFGKA